MAVSIVALLWTTAAWADCPPSPLPGCTPSARSGILRIDDSVDDRRDRLQLAWSGDLPAEALGNPTSGAGYSVCLYGVGPAVKSLAVPAEDGSCGRDGDAACWADLGNGKFKYRDSARHAGGLRSVSIRAATSGRGKIRAKAEGEHLREAETLPDAMPLPSPLAVTVQILRDDDASQCWSMSFADDQAKKNETAKFQALHRRNTDECATTPCRNGGECLDGVESYTCFCAWGFTGSDCETYIGACTSETCANGGACIPGVGDEVSCLCPPEWTGDRCEVNVAALCEARMSECGSWFEPGLGDLDCGQCGSDEFCVNNACEPVCDSSIFGGPTGDLFIHVANQLSDSDISPNRFDVATTDSTTRSMYSWRREEWVPRTDLGEKSLLVDFGSVPAPATYTLSFRFTPDSRAQTQTLVRSGDLRVEQVGDAVAVEAGLDTIVNDASTLRLHDCNHVAVVVDAGSVQPFFNGVPVEPLFAGALLGASLEVGPFAGKLWDLRVYSTALTAAEIDAVGLECTDARQLSTAVAGYPHYQCGPWRCIFWPDKVYEDPFDSQPENLDYFSYLTNYLGFERNIVLTRMYPRGELCEYLVQTAAPLDKAMEYNALSDGTRSAWVNGSTFDAPVVDPHHGLHEGFHGSQGRLKGYVGPSRGRWLAESTASWGSDYNAPGAFGNVDPYLALYTLLPHVPLYDQGSGTESESTGGHMYGAFVWHSYLTYEVVGSPAVIGETYSDTRAPASDALQSQFLVLSDLGLDMRELFLDFAARNTTWDYGYGSYYADWEVLGGYPDYKIAEDFDAAGTGGAWTAVPPVLRPGNWAYNSFLVAPAAQGDYRFSLRTAVGNPAEGEFRAVVIAHDEATGVRRYFPLEAGAAGAESSVDVPAADGESLYLVVAVTSLSEFLSGTDVYDYEYAIEAIGGDGYVPAPPPPPEPENLPPVIALSGLPSVIYEFQPVAASVVCTDPESGSALPVEVAPTDSCGGTLAAGQYGFTPGELAGETGCEVVVQCSDGIDVTTETRHVRIDEVDEAPFIEPFAAPPAGTGGILELVATDPDLPAQHLVWSLTSQPSCAAAYVDAEAGVLRWQCSGAASCNAGVAVEDGYEGGTDSVLVPLDCTGTGAPEVFDVAVRTGFSVQGTPSECFYRFLSPGGGADASTVEWVAGGTVIDSGRVMASGAAHTWGQSILCRVTPDDGASTGETVDSATVTVRRARQVSATIAATIENMVGYGDLVWFTVGGALWSTDGATAGPAALDVPYAISNVGDLTVWNGRLYFVATSSGHREVWSTDGAAVELAFRVNLAGSSGVDGIEVLDGRLYVSATDGARGKELFVSDDGTSAVLVVDGAEGAAGSGISLDEVEPAALVGDRLVFGGTWPSSIRDGVAGSLTRLNSVSASGPRRFRSVHGGVVFAGKDVEYQLWKSDGTSEGTAPVGSTPALLAPIGDDVFFFGSGFWLGRTDGTEAGTRLLFKIPYIKRRESDGNAVGSRFWFLGEHPVYGRSELFVTDGTEAGTGLVADIRPGSTGSNPSQFAATPDGRLFFRAKDEAGSSNQQVWVLE